MKIGLVIRAARLKQNMTQLELANALGYDSMQFVSLFERGLSKVPLKVLGKIFVILKFSNKEQKHIISGMIFDYKNHVAAEIEIGQEQLTE